VSDLGREPWWRDRDRLVAEYQEHGTLTAVSVAHNIGLRTLTTWWSRHGLPKLMPGPSRAAVEMSSVSEAPGDLAAAGPDEIDEWLRGRLATVKDGTTVEQLADEADVPPRRIRESLARLGESGYRVSAADEGHVHLERVVPSKENVHLGLLEGDSLRVGVVSDTHVGSRECAYEALELAYDWFAKEGIVEVWHTGDFGDGRGIYRGQASEVEHRTLDEQVQLLVDRYPRREGIRTRGIGGNHDLEGDAAAVGLDITAAFAARRDDVDYLGPYGSWLEAHGGAFVHLLHGRGGMTYAYSYKAQKLVDGYPGGRKPAVLICGHWHVRGSFEARGVQVLFPGCTQWQSKFMERLGLQPAVGFHLLEMTLGDDGSLVQFSPRWFRVWEGRVIG
jgi:predicted phosphodiesterase